jgi:hypothetical protein
MPHIQGLGPQYIYELKNASVIALSDLQASDMLLAVNAIELIGLVSSVLSIGQFLLGIGRRFFKKTFLTR